MQEEWEGTRSGAALLSVSSAAPIAAHSLCDVGLFTHVIGWSESIDRPNGGPGGFQCLFAQVSPLEANKSEHI